MSTLILGAILGIVGRRASTLWREAVPQSTPCPPCPPSLAIGDAVNLGALLDAVGRGANVARLMDDGKIAYGTARSVSDRHGNCLEPDQDVISEGFLRVVTSPLGCEDFWPVRELLKEFTDGCFVIDYL